MINEYDEIKKLIYEDKKSVFIRLGISKNLGNDFLGLLIQNLTNL
jgi:hypothetical protein